MHSNSYEEVYYILENQIENNAMTTAVTILLNTCCFLCYEIAFSYAHINLFSMSKIYVLLFSLFSF